MVTHDTQKSIAKRSRTQLIIPIVAAMLLVLIGIAIYSLSDRYRLYGVPSESMSPLIRAGDQVLVDTAYYDEHQPQDNDIAMIRLPTGEEFVRRIEHATTRDARIVAMNPEASAAGLDEAIIPFALLHGRVLAVPYSNTLQRVGILIPQPDAVLRPEMQN